MLKVYNTLGRKKEGFVPVEEGKVKMYVCGMTVYSDAHIGHARTYVAFDIIRRYLEHRGYAVTYVQNITDVDDKIIKAANGRGIEPLRYSAMYAERCLSDMDRLGVRRADLYPKASESIGDIIALIERIIENGYGYVADGDVYFSVEKFEDYGKLSGQRVDEMKAGARIEPGEKKRGPLDFALWKKAKEGEPSWDSPWGKGRPGWHIECSAMSGRYLGLPFDIHGGGHDLIFPHHENEIAQSEAATGRNFAKYWLHSGMLKVRGEKMSKSLGNIINIRDALDKWDAELLRFFFASYHYRSPADFSEENLDMAGKGLDRIRRLKEELEDTSKDADGKVNEDGLDEKGKEYHRSISRFREKFEDAMDDDFNTPEAIASIFEFVKDSNRYFKECKSADKNLCRYALKTLLELGNIITLFQEKKGVPTTKTISVGASTVIIPAIEGKIIRIYKLLNLLKKYNQNIYYKIIEKHQDVTNIILRYGGKDGIDNFLSAFPTEDKKFIEFTKKYENKIDKLLGELMDEIIRIRQNARKARDWEKSDAIRDELAELGFEIQDAGDETKWRRKAS